VVFSHPLANESLIGVDIGSDSIKVVHAEMTRQGARILRVAVCPTPADSIKEGVVINVPEVAAAIQFAVRSAGIKATNAIAATAGPGVIVRHVQLPKMTEQLLRRSILYEAGKYISASVEDSVVEFEILGDAEEQGQMNVMLVAAPRAVVDSRVQALERAGLETLAIDVEAFATFRALVEQHPDQSLLESTVALLDMGASHTEINLVCKGRLALTRTVPIAGASLTNAVKTAENCTDAEAEQRKHSLDMAELAKSSSGSAPNPGLKVLQSLIDEMLREVRRSINYYQSQLPDGAAETTVDRLILTGGTSRLKGLLSYAKSRLNVEVSIGNPGLRELMSSSPEDEFSEEDIPLLTVAFGLAVKEMSAAIRLSAAA